MVLVWHGIGGSIIGAWSLHGQAQTGTNVGSGTTGSGTMPLTQALAPQALAPQALAPQALAQCQ